MRKRAARRFRLLSVECLAGRSRCAVRTKNYTVINLSIGCRKCLPLRISPRTMRAAHGDRSVGRAGYMGASIIVPSIFERARRAITTHRRGRRLNCGGARTNKSTRDYREPIGPDSRVGARRRASTGMHPGAVHE